MSNEMDWRLSRRKPSCTSRPARTPKELHDRWEHGIRVRCASYSDADYVARDSTLCTTHHSPVRVLHHPQLTRHTFDAPGNGLTVPAPSWEREIVSGGHFSDGAGAGVAAVELPPSLDSV